MKILWTDGSADPNPGPGGWAVIDAATKTPVRTGSEKHTTNIRMEATALIEAIKFAVSENEAVEIHTDSEFGSMFSPNGPPLGSKTAGRKNKAKSKISTSSKSCTIFTKLTMSN